MKKIHSIAAESMKTFFFVFITLFLFSCGTKKNHSAESRNKSTLMYAVSPLEKMNIPAANDTSLKYNDSLFYRGVYFNNVGNYDSAIHELIIFSKLHPEISATYFQIARAYIGKDASIETIYRYINKAVELDSKNKWYLKYYADIKAIRGEYLQAANIYSELINNGNYDNEIFMKAFLNYEKAEAYDSMFSVVERMDKYTSIEDEYIDKMNVLIYSLKKDDSDLESYLLKKIEANENKLENQKLLLLFYIESKQTEKKEKLYNELDFYSLSEETQIDILNALILKYDTVLVADILQEAYFQRKNPELINTVEDALVKSVGYSPRTFQPYLKLLREWAEMNDSIYEIPQFLTAFYFSAKDLDSTVYYSRLSFEKGWMDITNFSLLYYGLLEQENIKGIQEVSEIALQRDSSFAVAYFTSAMASLFDEKYNVAYQNFLKAAETFDSSKYKLSFIAEIYMHLGDIYQRVENYDVHLVGKYYDSSLFYVPNNDLVLNNYAYYLSTIDLRLDDADSMSLITLQSQPNNPYYLDTYAWILYKKGNYKEAKEYLLKAIENSPEPSAVLWEHLGDIEAKLDNIEKAVKYYKIALEAKGDEETLKRKIAEYEK